MHMAALSHKPRCRIKYLSANEWIKKMTDKHNKTLLSLKKRNPVTCSHGDETADIPSTEVSKPQKGKYGVISAICGMEKIELTEIKCRMVAVGGGHWLNHTHPQLGSRNKCRRVNVIW